MEDANRQRSCLRFAKRFHEMRQGKVWTSSDKEGLKFSVIPPEYEQYYENIRKRTEEWDTAVYSTVGEK